MSYSKSLNLLLTTRAVGDGGAEKVWLSIARGFAARGDRVTLAVDEAPPRGFDLDETTNPRLVVLGRAHGPSLVRLTRQVRADPPDVALAAVSGSCVKLAAAVAMSRRRIPTIVSYHGFEEWRTGRLAACAYFGMPFLDRIADHVVGVSDGLVEELITQWGADPARTRRIYNPVVVDFAAARASARDLATRPPLVLAVGRLGVEKGMIDLVHAFARIARPDVRLAIAGEGPERGRLEARIAALGLSDRIELLGQTDPNPWYARARVFAVPSRTEAFGLVLVEALAHGLPIVATACRGPREILGEGRWGRIVPIGDADAMARGIEAALDAPGDPIERSARAEVFGFEAGMAEWARLVDAAAGRA